MRKDTSPPDPLAAAPVTSEAAPAPEVPAQETPRLTNEEISSAIAALPKEVISVLVDAVRTQIRAESPQVPSTPGAHLAEPTAGTLYQFVRDPNRHYMTVPKATGDTLDSPIHEYLAIPSPTALLRDELIPMYRVESENPLITKDARQILLSCSNEDYDIKLRENVKASEAQIRANKLSSMPTEDVYRKHDGKDWEFDVVQRVPLVSIAGVSPETILQRS